MGGMVLDSLESMKEWLGFEHFCNSGMFLPKAWVFLEGLETLRPRVPRKIVRDHNAGLRDLICKVW